jgi:hypothetical protein
VTDCEGVEAQELEAVYVGELRLIPEGHIVEDVLVDLVQFHPMAAALIVCLTTDGGGEGPSNQAGWRSLRSALGPGVPGKDNRPSWRSVLVNVLYTIYFNVC